MYRYVVAGALSAVAFSSQAQGYVGAVAALSSIGVDCAEKASCDKKGHGAKIYAGSKFDTANQFDLGGVGKDVWIEVGVVSFGKAATSELGYYYIVDPVNGGVLTDPISRQISKTATANALTVAAVAEFPIVNNLEFSLKLGAAYVSSTMRTYIDGVENGSLTETKLKPYIGLGVSYVVMNSFKIVGAYDHTSFDVDGRKSHVSNIGLGAEIGF
ncbi:MAG: outer membrane beta-barrel protein [Aquabacterium sp.]